MRCATWPSLIWTLSRSASLTPKPSRLFDVVLRDLHAALGLPEPAHAMRQPRRAKPDLRAFEAVADTEQDIFVSDLKAVEFEFAMPAMFLRPHDVDAADDAPARLVAVIEKGGEPAALVVGSARDDDEMRRLRGAGDEPFAAADDPLAVSLFGRRADHGRIGAAARRRLGHGEGGFDLAFDDRPQPPFLLRRRADARQADSCCRRPALRN